MSRPIQWWEPIAFFVCLSVFVSLRVPLVPYWWTDFQSDFAMVGMMAQHTKLGNFPIYFWGQNYMGGAEWLTAAILSSLIDGKDYISQMVLRINSLSWWLAASLIWFVAIRRHYLYSSYLFFFLSACASEHLLKISVLQELSPQALFFGGWIFWILNRGEVKSWLGFGILVGVSWWTNQGVVFFLLPALLIYHFLPKEIFWQPQYRAIFLPQPKLKRFYPVALGIIVLGIGIAIFGGLRLEHPVRLKIPNGISLARDAFLLLSILHISFYCYGSLKKGQRPAIFQRGLGLFVAGFLVGFAPSWLGKVFRLYESSYGVGLSILPLWKWPQQAMDLTSSIFVLFFSASSILFVGCLFFIFLPLVLVERKKLLKGSVLPFCVLVMVFNFTYVFFSERSEGVPVRYLYPAYFASLLGLAFLWGELVKKQIRWLGVVALIAISFYFSWNFKEQLVERGAKSVNRKIQLDSLVHLIHAGNFQYCWGDYWTAHVAAFLLEEKVVMAPHPDSVAPQVRRKQDYARVENQNPACFVYREQSDVLAPIYFSEVNPWTKR